MPKCVSGRGSASNPAGGTHDAPQTSNSAGEGTPLRPLHSASSAVWGALPPKLRLAISAQPFTLLSLVSYSTLSALPHCYPVTTGTLMTPGPRCKSTTGRHSQDRSRLSTNYRRSWCDRSRPVLDCNALQMFISCQPGSFTENVSHLQAALGSMDDFKPSVS